MNTRMMQALLAASLALAADAALACPGSDAPCPAVEGRFKEMDSNKDGFISKKEFDAEHGKRFKEMDANKDGKISLEEMRAAHEAKAPRYKWNADGYKTRFDEADADKDGMLTKEEAAKLPMVGEHFEEFDINKDGRLTHDEIRDTMRSLHRPHGMGMGGGMKPGAQPN